MDISVFPVLAAPHNATVAGRFEFQAPTRAGVYWAGSTVLSEPLNMLLLPAIKQIITLLAVVHAFVGHIMVVTPRKAQSASSCLVCKEVLLLRSFGLLAVGSMVCIAPCYARMNERRIQWYQPFAAVVLCSPSLNVSV